MNQILDEQYNSLGRKIAKTETATLQGKVLRETDKAMLVHFGVVDRTVWIPLSQVFEIHTNREGESEIVMSAWIAKVKELV